MDTLEDVNDSVSRLGDALISKVKTHVIKSTGSPVLVKFGERYHVIENTSIQLPPGRLTDGYIYLSKTVGAGSILVKVAAATSDQFEVAGIFDTELLFDVERPIVLWWNSVSLKWMV
jgi:hypothetical protein